MPNAQRNRRNTGPPGGWFAALGRIVRGVIAGHGQGWCAADAIGAKAAARRGVATQGRHGDLVCLFLWHAGRIR